MQLVVFVIAYPFLWVISRLPYGVFYALSDFVFFLIYRVLSYRKKMVRFNLKTAFPQKSQAEIIAIEEKFYRHFCDIFLEMVKTFGLSKTQMQKRMIFPNLEVLKSFQKERKSFILMCGHYNSYEWLLSLAQHLNCPSYAAYTPISNKYFDRFIRSVRMRFNAFLVSRYAINSVIHKHKLSGEMCVYGLASDQSPSSSPKHYWRHFLGVEVPVFTGAERIAKQFNIPVVYCEIQKIKRGYYQTIFHILTENPEQVADFEITDAFTNLLEKQIYTQPEFYLWTHNRFKHRGKNKKKTDNLSEKKMA